MKALILQAFGIGDVIFAMGVAEHIRWQGYEIEWPVKPHFVEGLQRAYPSIKFTSDEDYPPGLFMIKEDIVVNGERIIPIRWSDHILKMDSKYWMKTKYMLYGLDYTKWKKSAYYYRDSVKELELYNSLGLKNDEEYNLINQTYKSTFGGNVPIKVENGLRNIEMIAVPGFSIFDWSYVLQNATNIHVVNSAVFYLLELLDLKAKQVHLYSRHPEERGFPYIEYLISKDYILHP